MTPAPGASGTTNRPGIRTTCESPREIDLTSISEPSARTVSAAQAMASASGPLPPVMTVPPRRSVYSWVTHRGYTRAGSPPYPSSMRTSVLVLGAGFGGLELSSRLVSELGDAVDVTLIDRSDAFVFGFAKLDMTFGRRTPESIRLPYAAIGNGVRFRRETITAIDPETRRVTTDAGTHEADILVVALGADYDLAATPGLAEGGNEFYSIAGATAVRESCRRSARAGP